MVQSTSAKQAKEYYTDALLKADYYLDDQELKGKFQGRLAERLGLSGYADKHSFFSLCDNINPKTSEPLTPRTNEERTTGYDINFHCPKSVSLISALSKDNHIIELFSQSVTATMMEIEAASMTRVRKGRQQFDRETEELVWVDFVHQTSRPTDGMPPDPHLHSHCYVFNMTYDEQEQELKAGQFREINRRMPYYQALFHKHLSDRLIERGYKVRKTAKSFEIEGVPNEVLAMFSKRTDEIGRIAKEKGITGAKELAELGAKTRSKKQKGLTMSELKTLWKEQIKAADLDKVENNPIRTPYIKEDKAITVERCVNHALHHSFERASVMQMHRLEAVALQHSIGNASVSPDALKAQLRNDQRLITVQERYQTLCTTKEVLQEEKRMIALAKEGLGNISPLYKEGPALSLQGQQAAAVTHVLTTTNRVSIVRGAAGVGKTHLMKEARQHIEAAGKQMMVVAPSSDASRGVLRDEGFEQAETVAMFLADKKMQERVSGQVLWVDEAGLLGTKDMGDLISIANQRNAQLVFGGDTRQHASVVRGDALRILNTVGGIKTAEVNKIYRQKDIEYRKAIASISEGKLLEGFNHLDGIGSIQKVDPLKPNEQLVKDYIAAVKEGKECLVISPTHKQGDQVTEDIRKALRKEKLIGKKEIITNRLNNLNLTIAQKSDWRNFKEGQVIQFNQHVRGIKRGEALTVDKIAKDKVQLKSKEGGIIDLPLNKASSFDILETGPLALSKGDKVRVTRNVLDKGKKKLNNGQMLRVESIGKSGELTLRNTVSKTTYKVNSDFGHLTHAHCITSHASQGKTVDQVFISQPAGTFGAADARQFYVSASRGRERAVFYTDDKEGLLEHVARLGNRQSAHELVQAKHQGHIAVLERQKNEIDKDRLLEIDRDWELTEHLNNKERDYEPEL